MRWNFLIHDQNQANTLYPEKITEDNINKLIEGIESITNDSNKEQTFCSLLLLKTLKRNITKDNINELIEGIKNLTDDSIKAKAIQYLSNSKATEIINETKSFLLKR